jgi:uncharacterized protein
MAMAPLFIKYQTKTESFYVYDTETNEIIRIGEVIYEILDDYHILDAEEIVDKYYLFNEGDLRNALALLDKLQTRGILCDHLPQVSSVAKQTRCRGKDESFVDLLKNRRRLLILEITQKCNLRCEYCCYGEHYPELRQHGDETMSLDVAKNAVRDFVNHDLEKCSIGFYGGEPLLEFELLKQIVWFAEDLVATRGMKPIFSITTNGTLLTDDKLHFLVQHEFDITISLDGTKELHDIYRVFKNDEHPELRIGSFDVVMRNLQRFIELYPEYMKREVRMTLTATTDLDQINNLLKHLDPAFSSFSVSYVRDVLYLEGGTGQPVQIGAWEASSFDNGPCGRELSLLEKRRDASQTKIDRPMHSEISRKIPDFCNWTKERKEHFRFFKDHLMEEFDQNIDTDEIQRDFPLNVTLFRNENLKFHDRKLSNRPRKCHYAYRCFPGSARTFCSAQGILYPCERTETGELFKLGDIINGVDFNSANRIMEISRLLGDCGNCVTKRSCHLCPSSVSENKNSGGADALKYQKECRGEIGNLISVLTKYTSVMETNKDKVNKILQKQVNDDWLNDVVFLPTVNELNEVEVGVEELEGWG